MLMQQQCDKTAWNKRIKHQLQYILLRTFILMRQQCTKTTLEQRYYTATTYC
uniref:Uncharacterized protein n=1 Tax=Anguilla anguilla TaxID=7936 RepID=A0A0E9SX07_ANGAN